MDDRRPSINEGDHVMVYFTQINHLTEFQSTKPFIRAKVVGVPYDTGDSWKLDVNGNLVYINPNCSDFVGIRKENRF